jgi:hypothetical protein
MSKAFHFTLILSAFSLIAFSQSAYEGTVEYNKKKHDAFVIDYPYPPEAVEEALIKRMEKLGYKTKAEKGLFNKDKGFIVHKSAFVTDVHEGSLDYVFKVDRKSRKEKDESVIYMILIKDGENAKAGFSAEDVEKAKAFLNNLHPDVETSDLELKIKKQDDVVVKSEKKFKNLQDNQASLEKKMKELQAELEQNLKDQELQQKEIENQKKLAEEMKGRRKSSL